MIFKIIYLNKINKYLNNYIKIYKNVNIIYKTYNSNLAGNTIYDIVATVIHEYTHYLQVRRKYREYELSRYYSQNPMERQAKRNEDKYTKICLKEIKKQL